MKYYKDSDDNTYVYFDNAFDEEGNVTHEKVKNDIETFKLIELTEEEYSEIQVAKQKESEIEITTQAELEQSEKDAEFLEMLEKWGGM